MRPEIKWPAIIIAALTVHALAWVAVVVLATSNPTYAVEEGYYQKALEWDAKRAQDHRNTELGWQLAATVTPAAVLGGDATLKVWLTDRDGTPVDDASVRVDAFHNTRADTILQATLSPDGDAYVARLPMRRSGRWELRFTVDRGEDLFTEVLKPHLELR